MVHGKGGDETVMEIFSGVAPPDWLLVFPRAILPDPQTGGYSWTLAEQAAFPTLDDLRPAVDALDRIVERLPDLHGANPARLYAMGFSQGAAASFAHAYIHPGRIKAIASLVGFLPSGIPSPTEAGPQPTLHLTGLLVFMANGLDDDRILIARARSDAGRLRALGTRLQYHEYPTGHKLNADGMRDLQEWWSALAA